MIYRGKPLSELTDAEYQEAVLQNNRFAEVSMNLPQHSPRFRSWHRKACELLIEGKRRGLIELNGDHVVG